MKRIDFQRNRLSSRNRVSWLPVFLLLLAALLIPAGALLAMESTNYRLAWFVPLTGSGGQATSANYAVNLTAGQSVIGTTSGPAMAACLGYWCGEPAGVIYLPVVLNADGDAD